jgi:hypothetical protein
MIYFAHKLQVLLGHPIGYLLSSQSFCGLSFEIVLDFNRNLTDQCFCFLEFV